MRPVELPVEVVVVIEPPMRPVELPVEVVVEVVVVIACSRRARTSGEPLVELSPSELLLGEDVRRRLPPSMETIDAWILITEVNCA